MDKDKKSGDMLLPHTITPMDGSDLIKTGSRPVSFYDNFLSNGKTANNVDIENDNSCNEYPTKDTRPLSIPTPSSLMSTTVPQNMAAQIIGGKHTPTRSSLRHSRMIVLNKNTRIPPQYLPAIIRYQKMAKTIMACITLVGTLLTLTSLWLILWTPNLKRRDNPFYAAIPALFSGIMGLILLCCCRKQYPGMKRNNFVYSIKVMSVISSTLATALTFISGIFAIFHLAAMHTMACHSKNLNMTCMCSLDKKASDMTGLAIRDYDYEDITCAEVYNILYVIILFVAGCSFTIGLLEVWYLYLHWASRSSYTYSKISGPDDSPNDNDSSER